MLKLFLKVIKKRTARYLRSRSSKSANLFNKLPLSLASNLRQGEPSWKALRAAFTAFSTSAYKMHY